MKNLLIIFTIAIAAFACNKPTNYVLIKTTLGDVTIELYDETPQHRDNFQKLVSEGFYEGLLFHRVISEFMIQGGDPDSKSAPKGARLGSGGPGYRIPAELNASDRCFHKKGALAAAREGDRSNPEKASSGSQFYITVGKKYSDTELAQMEQRRMKQAKQSYYREISVAYRDTIASLAAQHDKEAIKAIQNKVKGEVEMKINAEADKYFLSLEQKAAYKEVGGTPHLDNNYTVFGEVIEGLEVLDAIAEVETNKQDRPLKNIVMSMSFVKR